MPSSQVATFQPSAETKMAASMPAAMPPLGGDRASGGISSTRAYATAMPPSITPRKFMIPDHTTATAGFSEWV